LFYNYCCAIFATDINAFNKTSKDMTILNLDEYFKPLGEGVDFQKFDFPSGCEPHIKLFPILDEKVKITCRIKSANDLLLLLLAVDALKRSGARRLECFIPYLPFARQDRVMVKGEPLSVKVISNLLNTQGFEKVQIYDAHSEVCLALIDNSESITNHSFVAEVLQDKIDYRIISPDAGAYKKIFKVCQHLNYKDEIVLCNKTRDVKNGNITNVTCAVNDFQGLDLYIIDDICDGGGTFILLADELKKRNCGKINLIVSHGIFSKGVDALVNIDHIYTTDSFKDLEDNQKLTQYKLQNLI
jgi:ribose-phosphate pyrophosphokinase